MNARKSAWYFVTRSYTQDFRERMLVALQRIMFCSAQSWSWHPLATARDSAFPLSATSGRSGKEHNVARKVERLYLFTACYGLLSYLLFGSGFSLKSWGTNSIDFASPAIRAGASAGGT